MESVEGYYYEESSDCDQEEFESSSEDGGRRDFDQEELACQTRWCMHLMPIVRFADRLNLHLVWRNLTVVFWIPLPVANAAGGFHSEKIELVAHKKSDAHYVCSVVREYIFSRVVPFRDELLFFDFEVIKHTDNGGRKLYVAEFSEIEGMFGFAEAFFKTVRREFSSVVDLRHL